MKNHAKIFKFILLQTPYGAKFIRIICDKVDGFIRKYDKTKYPGLFHSYEKYEIIFERVRYLIVLKSNMSDVYYQQYMKIKINFDEDYLPLEKK